MRKGYPDAQEEFIDGSHPKFIYTQQKLNSPRTWQRNEIFQRLTKQYCVMHELQWGEVLYIVYGYLMIHAPSSKDEGEPMLAVNC